MPFTYTIESLKPIVNIAGQGRIEPEDSTTLLIELVSNTAFTESHMVLVDLRESRYVPTFEEVSQNAETLDRIRKEFHNRIAVLVANDVVKAMGKALLHLCQDRELRIEVFADVDKAMAWLVEADAR